MSSDIRQTTHGLVPFIVITFGWSWLFWLPSVLSTLGWFDLPRATGSALGTIAVFGPSVAAFFLTYGNEGWQGVRRLWKRGWTWQSSRRWLLPALLLLPGITLLTVGLMTLMGDPPQMEYALPPTMIAPLFLMIYVLNALPEEYGWRGYALDRLQTRWNALLSSVILGAIWGLWHLPLHFIGGSVQEVIPIWQAMAQTIVLAVFYTWVYNNTHGSVLAVALLHTTGNISAAALPYWISGTGRLVNFGLLVVVAVVIIAVWGPRKLVREKTSC